MSYTLSVSKRANIGGKVVTKNSTLTNEQLVAREISKAAGGKTGSLTTRTDADTGTLTMAGGHGITTGQRLDVYWTEAGVEGSRRGMTVGTVSVNSVPIDGGTGDNLPTNTTAVIAAVPEENTFVVTGDNVTGLTLWVDGVRGAISVCNASNVELYGKTLTDGFMWFTGEGPTNPLAGLTTIAKVFMSNVDTALARTMSISALTS